MRRVAIAALLLLAATAGVLALDGPARKAPAPRIDRVAPDDGVLPGGTLTLAGSGFSIFASDGALEEIKSYREALRAVCVTIGGVSAPVERLADDRLVLTVPAGLRPGSARVEVAVEGKKASIETTIRFEVDRYPEPRLPPDPFPPLGEPPPRCDLEVVATATTSATATVISVTGTAEGIPDGRVVTLALSVGARDVDLTSAEVRGARFAARFGPYRGALAPGIYGIYARYHGAPPSSRPPSAESDRRAHTSVRVGTHEDALALTRELRRRASVATATAIAILEEIAIAYGAAGRSGFAQDGVVDERAWEEWLEKRALTAFPAPARRGCVARMRRSGMLGAGSTLDVGKWRAFIDGRRETIKAHIREQEVYTRRLLGVPHGETLHAIDELWRSLADISVAWSRELYENAKLPPDDTNDPKTESTGAATVLRLLSQIQDETWDPE